MRLTVAATLQYWSGDASGSHYLMMPSDAADALRVEARANPRGFGSVRVECAIGDVRWRTSVFPRKDGGYFLPVKIEVVRRAALSAGGSVTVAIEPVD